MNYTVSGVRLQCITAGLRGCLSRDQKMGVVTPSAIEPWWQDPCRSLVSLPSRSLPLTEAIVESALYKCVLKPLKEAINSCLREIHSKDGSLQQLKENQLVILATTTTDLGVTTSVPEVPVMEKILQKFASMHKAYSPEKKISILLKTCKLIYDSMALGHPGRRAAGGGWAGGSVQAATLCGSVTPPCHGL